MTCDVKCYEARSMLVSLLFASLAQCTPFIVFDKKILADDGKINEPVHVMYRIYNLGDSPAHDLHIDDAGIPLEQWDFPKSANNLHWSTLNAGGNITHIFDVKPLIAGNLRMGSSRLRFTADGQKKIALSSQAFWFESRSTRSIGARDNFRGYAITVLAALAAIFVPFVMWLVTKTSAPAQKSKTA
ncbi:hypothetical protein TRFO_17851 [Tritrichomonas foetus]|uniref:Translocon-associated protein subunit beta n=1 Tax=Tritrichomonas foetus TaxID=1144522 RepID=A0A1J4KN89_9EUKA|nr:hypothetical protein TRFO_17851 [Tritrichomonas foetus]|eukprot:OHT12368.1 hypothetical protein TRFO_17851 [Tritrichomonas foetus]